MEFLSLLIFGAAILLSAGGSLAMGVATWYSLRYSASEWVRAYRQGRRALKAVATTYPDQTPPFFKRVKLLISFTFNEFGNRYKTITLEHPEGDIELDYNGTPG